MPCDAGIKSCFIKQTPLTALEVSGQPRRKDLAVSKAGSHEEQTDTDKAQPQLIIDGLASH